MCLILFAHQAHDDYPLIVAANRDEWHNRPTVPSEFWDTHPDLLAGRDLQAGGTWMGITRAGRFAALTNFRDVEAYDPAAPSRGLLVLDYLRDRVGAESYLNGLAQRAGAYRGFNILAGDMRDLYFYSNRQSAAVRVEPGVHGLSNALMDTPWPKVRRGMEAIQAQLDGTPTAEALLDLLERTDQAPDEALPQTGVSLDWERRLSAAHILHSEYGTRSATVFLRHRSGQCIWVERSYDPEGHTQIERRFEFQST
ncbi:MAG TPA: NRDE family protein [Burkholderiales bacterium]|nr:NRDE family protein [Burkholderiales bacterium]